MARPHPAGGGPLRHLRATDLRAAARLATDAVAGVARLVEGVHQSVLGTLGDQGGAGAGRTSGLTGRIYRTVSGATHMVGRGVDGALALIEPVLARALGAPIDTPQREAVLAALNGVIGDRLAADASPLATRMQLRTQDAEWTAGAAPAAVRASRRVVLMVHGLCMNDLQWRAMADDRPVDHGAMLAAAMGAVPLYLRYNTGRHISDNGRDLAALLEQRLGQDGVAPDSLTVLAHSMGGLVMRSAVHQARRAGMRWPAQLRHIVFLGTPHHGAPLERAGHGVDILLAATPWSAPFARIGQLRSAGITDLRYGLLAEEDWRGRQRFRRQPDTRQHLPLPDGVACFAMAATLAARRSPAAERLVGDGLVPLPSALGRHVDPLRALVFAESCQAIAWRTGHLALLRSPQVAQQLLRWLAPAPEGAPPGT